MTLSLFNAGAVVAAIFAIGVPMYALNCKTRHTFSYRFFSKPCCIVTAIAIGLIALGFKMQHGMGHVRPTDFYEGYRCMVLGIIVYLPVAFFNFLKTNLLIGASGSLAQLAVIPTAVIIGAPVLLMASPLIFLYFCSRPYRVHVVHRYND